MQFVFGLLGDAWKLFSRTAINFDSRHWTGLVIGMIIVGVLCMKGSGKRL